MGFPQNSLLHLFPGTKPRSQIKVGSVAIILLKIIQNQGQDRKRPFWGSHREEPGFLNQGTATKGVTLSPFAFSSNGFKPPSTALRRLETLL